MSNSIFGTGNLHWCPLVPMKWQVLEWVIRLNIQDLRCDVGFDRLHISMALVLEIRAFHGAIYKKIQYTPGEWTHSP